MKGHTAIEQQCANVQLHPSALAVRIHLRCTRGPGAVVKAACLESRISRFRIPLWLQVSKKQNIFSSLTCKDSILWGASVTERARARISNPMSEEQCHLTIFRRFSWPSVAYICAQSGPKPNSFYFILPRVHAQPAGSTPHAPAVVIRDKDENMLTHAQPSRPVTCTNITQIM